MDRIKGLARLVWEVIQAFNADKCTFLAAGLCYFIFFSFFPFLLLTVAVTGYFLTAEQAMAQASRVVTQIYPQQQSFLLDILQGVIAHRGQATFFGVATLLWSAKNIFLTMGQSLNIIWGIPTDRGVIKENLLAVALTLSVGLFVFLLGVSYAVLTAIVQFRFPILGLSPSQIPGFVFLIANIVPVTLATVILMGLYLILPNHRLTWNQVLPGALTAAVTWEIARRLFGYFVENMARYEMVYGSISGIVGFLFWIFISANLFLLGAEIAWVLNEHHGGLAKSRDEEVEKTSLSDRRA